MISPGGTRLLTREAAPVIVVRGPGLVSIAVLVVAVAQLLLAGPGRAAVVVPTMLLVPGWLAWVAVFGRQRPRDPVVAITFAVALGMVVLILNGLMVNAIGVRLSEFSLVAGPAVISCGLLLIGRIRGSDPSIRFPTANVPRVAVPVIVVVCSLAIGVAAVTYAAGRLPPAASPPFTEVSFAPAYAQSAQPVHLVPGRVLVVPVEVRLTGRTRVPYRVVTSVDGAQASTVPYTVTAPLWKTGIVVTAPTGRCLHQIRIDFVPQAPGAKSNSLTTYFSVSEGPACQH